LGGIRQIRGLIVSVAGFQVKLDRGAIRKPRLQGSGKQAVGGVPIPVLAVIIEQHPMPRVVEDIDATPGKAYAEHSRIIVRLGEEPYRDIRGEILRVKADEF